MLKVSGVLLPCHCWISELYLEWKCLLWQVLCCFHGAHPWLQAGVLPQSTELKVLPCASIFVISKYMLKRRKNHGFPSTSALSGPPATCMEGREWNVPSASLEVEANHLCFVTQAWSMCCWWEQKDAEMQLKLSPWTWTSHNFQDILMDSKLPLRDINVYWATRGFLTIPAHLACCKVSLRHSCLQDQH